MKQFAYRYEWDRFPCMGSFDSDQLFNLFKGVEIAYAVDDSGNVTRWAATSYKSDQWATVVKNITDCTDDEIERLYQYYLTCDRDAINDDIANYVCARKGLHRICGYSDYGNGNVSYHCLCGNVKDDYEVGNCALYSQEPWEPKEVADAFDEVDPRSAEEFAEEYTPKLNEYIDEYIQEYLNDEEL